MEFIFLEFGQLVMGAGLMILTIAISAWHRLGLEYQLALATGRLACNYY
jgi:ABC-type iron transport system FetAB permease component